MDAGYDAKDAKGKSRLSRDRIRRGGEPVVARYEGDIFTQ